MFDSVRQTSYCTRYVDNSRSTLAALFATDFIKPALSWNFLKAIMLLNLLKSSWGLTLKNIIIIACTDIVLLQFLLRRSRLNDMTGHHMLVIYRKSSFEATSSTQVLPPFRSHHVGNNG